MFPYVNTNADKKNHKPLIQNIFNISTGKTVNQTRSDVANDLSANMSADLNAA